MPGETRVVLEDFLPVSDSDLLVQFLAATVDGDRDRLAHWSIRDPGNQIVTVFDRLAVHGDNDVVRLDAGGGGGSSGNGFGHNDTVVVAESLQKFGLGLPGELDPDGTACDSAILDDGVIDAGRRVNRQREADAF